MFLASLICLASCGYNGQLVKISSDPVGAEIYYQKKLIGTAPVETKIEQLLGDYNVYRFTARKQGYKPQKLFFKEEFYHETVDDIVPPEIHFSLEEREKYPIKITSEPAGATLFFNGKRVGVTPITVIVLENIGVARTFRFRVEKEGWGKKEKTLEEYVPEKDEAPYEFPTSIHFEM